MSASSDHRKDGPLSPEAGPTRVPTPPRIRPIVAAVVPAIGELAAVVEEADALATGDGIAIVAMVRPAADGGARVLICFQLQDFPDLMLSAGSAPHRLLDALDAARKRPPRCLRRAGRRRRVPRRSPGDCPHFPH